MKKYPAEIAETVAARLAASKRELAEATTHGRIGEAVCHALAARDTVSLADLIAAFEGEVARCPSTRGEGAPEHDMRRQSAEAVIRQLRSLRPPADAESRSDPSA